MKAEENGKSAQSIQEEGNKVSGGTEPTKNESPEGSGTSTNEGKNAEHDSSQVSEKDKMTGYNALPDQEKVGE